MPLLPTDPAVGVHSMAGKASCCYVDSMNVAFDMGVNFLKSAVQDHVFISHGHIDHIQALPAHAAERQLNGMKPATYYMPSHLVQHVESIMASYSKMQETEIQAVLVGVDAGAVVHVSSRVAVKAFETVHRVASLGYVAYAISKRLKAEFAGLSGREIAVLRKQNVVLEDIVWTPTVAYTGDTSIEFYDDPGCCSEFLRSRVLVTECTFLGDTPVEAKADETGHIHLNQLARRLALFQNISLVLTHFSMRYSFHDIRNTLTSHLLPREHTLASPSTPNPPSIAIFMAHGDRWASISHSDVEDPAAPPPLSTSDSPPSILDHSSSTKGL
ncbi:hypothetical protein H310_05470 [Aphanomyces invadans]|uniref:Metallo-beta-lactamase domain-containing protein n=1 Tax=Aphanomyces invadans TaxID=157072 RepID=A0A024U9T7_9STRA|nr:hypothetical protein H310_05470 [Aphanomyces invadans]ETW03039.1 hypothetical protein H310_05470 [Aphanomyces invadans]|eukprot:XP_008868423.1 hypothetical protein H310_05470 [Aphanomyces invadans]